jgi:hypothetical protein
MDIAIPYEKPWERKGLLQKTVWPPHPDSISRRRWMGILALGAAHGTGAYFGNKARNEQRMATGFQAEGMESEEDAQNRRLGLAPDPDEVRQRPASAEHFANAARANTISTGSHGLGYALDLATGINEIHKLSVPRSDAVKKTAEKIYKGFETFVEEGRAAGGGPTP